MYSSGCVGPRYLATSNQLAIWQQRGAAQSFGAQAHAGRHLAANQSDPEDMDGWVDFNQQ